jgi:hypothetical protein
MNRKKFVIYNLKYMSKRKLDREATIQNIIKAAGENIRDASELQTADDEFLVDAAMLWEAEVVYK